MNISLYTHFFGNARSRTRFERFSASICLFSFSFLASGRFSNDVSGRFLDGTTPFRKYRFVKVESESVNIQCNP